MADYIELYSVLCTLYFHYPNAYCLLPNPYSLIPNPYCLKFTGLFFSAA